MPNELEGANGPDEMAEEEDKPAEEGVVPRVTPSPGMPSARDRALHRITHIPYRSWCDDCVRGRGRDRHHKLCGAWERSTVSKVHMDYCFLTESTGAIVSVDGKDTDQGGVASTSEAPSGRKDESKGSITTLVVEETGC